jgi:hypothetical protein
MENTMVPYRLDLKTVRKKANEFYKAKRLLAQHPDKGYRLCQNRVGEYRCSAAACYPDDIINLEFGTVEDGIAKGYLLPPDNPEDFGKIIRIQFAHDHWAFMAKILNEDNLAIGMMERNFISWIEM